MEFLRNIKLSVAEWLALAGAAIIGVLVMALRVQGGRLHRAKVDLLDQRFAARAEKVGTDLDRASKAYSDALQEYFDAGGKL